MLRSEREEAATGDANFADRRAACAPAGASFLFTEPARWFRCAPPPAISFSKPPACNSDSEWLRGHLFPGAETFRKGGGAVPQPAIELRLIFELLAAHS